MGQQAVVLVATPGKPNTSYRVFGAKPLEDVVRNLRCMIMEELENALAQQVARHDRLLSPSPSVLRDVFRKTMSLNTMGRYRKESLNLKSTQAATSISNSLKLK